MRKLILLALLALFLLAQGLALSGCQETGEVENQAYVLVLALDRAENDALTLTVRVPKIGKSDAKVDNGRSGDSPYLTFSVSAPSWSSALDALQWATPRRINLSHIEMIVASEELAARPTFHALMNAVAGTPHLYANARFVVCRGSAADFLKAGETVIGTRLSSEIRAMLSQYARQGFIPEVCLADACYDANGIYGDPVAIWAELGASETVGKSIEVAESSMRQRFSGTALFRGGRFIHGLSIRQSRLLNLVRGQCSVLPCPWHGGLTELSVKSPVKMRVDFDGEGVKLVLSMKLRAPEGLSATEASALEAQISRDVGELIADCQNLECDPFGFSESAAAHFPSVPQWLKYDWREHYRSAPTDIDVRIDANRASSSNP